MADLVVGALDLSVAPDGVAYAIPDETSIQASFEEIAHRADQSRVRGQRTVVVQGLGFVGAAVCVALASGRDELGRPLYFVVGVDLPSPTGYWKVARINEGSSPVSAPDTELHEGTYEAVHFTRNLCATACEQAYALADVIVVDVPLSVAEPSLQTASEICIDLGSFEGAIRAIGRQMRPDALVVIETTVPVGACDQVVVPVLNDERKLRGIEGPLYVTHAYERVMPGPNYLKSVREFWRTFSGIDKASAEKGRKFLSSFIATDSHPLWQLEDTASSELGKLLENSYRAVNIAFIYEWTLLAERVGINLFAVIDSIRVRKGTHDNIRFPGFGVGGYCLTKDSLLAQWASTQWFGNEVTLRMTLDALRTNYRMPLHTLDLLSELAEGAVTGKTIAVFGASYLPEVADTRNSPTLLLVDELVKSGAVVVVHDPYVKTWRERQDIRVTQDLAECTRQADGLVFAVGHPDYRGLPPRVLLENASSPPFIVDAQNVIQDETAELLHQAGCRLLGVGKGHWRKKGFQWRN